MRLQIQRFRCNALVHFQLPLKLKFSKHPMLYSHPLTLSLHPRLPAGSCSLRTVAVHLLQGSVWLRVRRRICCVYLNAFASACVCV